MALVDGTGTKVVEYTYDAWGKQLTRTGTMANSLGKIQPFRYRGYVYDEESGLYYLRSRYYRPGWGRFVSADAMIVSSLYKYANSNPVNCIDSDGHDAQRKKTTDADFNDTITPGMRMLLYNSEEYYYIGKSKNSNGGLDCIWGVNIALGKIIAKKVDSAWRYYVNKHAQRGWIDYDNLHPGDIVFSLDRRDPNYNTPSKIKRIDHAMKGHIGIVVTFDFPDDEEDEVLAVFQVCSEELSKDEWTALFYGDTGPNITALKDKNGYSNWMFYIRPKK